MVGGRSRLGVLLGCRLVESACARGGHRAARRPSRAGATMSPTEGGPSSKGEHSPETERLEKVAHAGAEVERQARGQGVRPGHPVPLRVPHHGYKYLVRPPPDPSSRHRTRASLPSTTRVGRAPRVIVRALAATRPRHRRPSPRARAHTDPNTPSPDDPLGGDAHRTRPNAHLATPSPRLEPSRPLSSSSSSL